jgi:hypothetical protein
MILGIIWYECPILKDLIIAKEPSNSFSSASHEFILLCMNVNRGVSEFLCPFEIIKNRSSFTNIILAYIFFCPHFYKVLCQSSCGIYIKDISDSLIIIYFAIINRETEFFIHTYTYRESRQPIIYN